MEKIILEVSVDRKQIHFKNDIVCQQRSDSVADNDKAFLSPMAAYLAQLIQSDKYNKAN